MTIEHETIEINKWKTPATDYPKKELRSVRIVHGFYDRGYYHNYGVRGYKYFEVTKQIPVTSLEIKPQQAMSDDKSKENSKVLSKENSKVLSKENSKVLSKAWTTWMVDDPPHFWSMQDYARNSLGKVLVAGLGLGLVVHELLNNVDIDSITVVEKNKDVIDLISPLLPKPENVAFEIINEDFYVFIDETNKQFDRIIIDLWTTGSKEETMKVLTEEVEPLSYYIQKLFPDASVVFHGFGIEW